MKQLVSQDSAPPEAMACLRVVTDQKSMDTILQFGKTSHAAPPGATPLLTFTS